MSDGVSGGQRERIDVSAMEQRERIERRGRRCGVVREARLWGAVSWGLVASRLMAC